MSSNSKVIRFSKFLRILIPTIFLNVFFIIGNGYAQNEKPIPPIKKSLPFKAKMVDECIDEKACLKYIFLHEVIKNYDTLSENQKADYKLSRWKGPVYIGLLGSNPSTIGDAQSYIVNATQITKSLAPYFGHPLQMVDDRSKINVTIIYGEDIDREMKKNSGVFSHFSSDFIKIIKSNNDKSYPKVARFSKNTTDPNIINYGAILIQKKDGADKVCYFSLLTRLLGINEMPSKSFGLVNYDDCHATNLHRLILTMLQERGLKSGANINQIEYFIDEYYAKFILEAKGYKMKPSEMIAKKAAN